MVSSVTSGMHLNRGGFGIPAAAAAATEATFSSKTFPFKNKKKSLNKQKTRKGDLCASTWRFWGTFSFEVVD